MSDWNDLMRFSKAKLPTAIMRWPSGSGYGFVGAVPISLTVEDTRSLSIGARKSMTFPNEQAAIDALLSIGIKRFQLADCSWYGGAR